MDKIPNLYHPFLKRFQKTGVDYLLIGVSGINYFAKDARQIISTADYDLFIRPTPENILKALQALRKEEYETAALTASGQLRSTGRLTPMLAKRLARTKRTVVGTGPYQLIVELCLEVSGFTFDEMKRNAVWMYDKELKFKFLVASLPDLLKSKQVANREKDRLFLAKYKRILEE